MLEVGASGTAGGLLSIWNPDIFKLKSFCSNRNFILVKGTYYNQFSCIIVNIYAPCDTVERRKLWQTICNIKPLFTGPWCLGGDLNERNFTWSNTQEGGKWSRIDRYWVDHEWLDKYKIKQWGLPRSFSDHCPSVSSGGGEGGGERNMRGGMLGWRDQEEMAMSRDFSNIFIA
ncbi:hypothetical protein RHMOL_Rhmol06G0277200 [Rhododendron molle]|uniref:Uncharacterized protein n=1 Tax=Rhododendron molle TaxID=49168 RepID=A0ACC0NH88_RHOML|nr:hypothetical protein RHMOL_Rhmol06G0277200 [Rhododendron molle]